MTVSSVRVEFVVPMLLVAWLGTSVSTLGQDALPEWTPTPNILAKLQPVPTVVTSTNPNTGAKIQIRFRLPNEIQRDRTNQLDEAFPTWTFGGSIEEGANKLLRYGAVARLESNEPLSPAMLQAEMSASVKRIINEFFSEMQRTAGDVAFQKAVAEPEFGMIGRYPACRIRATIYDLEGPLLYSFSYLVESDSRLVMFFGYQKTINGPPFELEAAVQTVEILQ